MPHLLCIQVLMDTFLVWAVVSSGAMKRIEVHVSFQIKVFSKYMPRTGISPYCSLFLEITLLPLQPYVFGKFSELNQNITSILKSYLCFMGNIYYFTSLCPHRSCAHISTLAFSMWLCFGFIDSLVFHLRL